MQPLLQTEIYPRSLLADGSPTDQNIIKSSWNQASLNLSTTVNYRVTRDNFQSP